MQEVESVLARRAEALGVEILRGQAVNGFQETPEGVDPDCRELQKAAARCFL